MVLSQYNYLFKQNIYNLNIYKNSFKTLNIKVYIEISAITISPFYFSSFCFFFLISIEPQ